LIYLVSAVVICRSTGLCAESDEERQNPDGRWWGAAAKLVAAVASHGFAWTAESGALTVGGGEEAARPWKEEEARRRRALLVEKARRRVSRPSE
jgi:hypothetical protein